MRPNDTEITSGRIRLIKIVAVTLVVSGIANMVFAYCRLVGSGRTVSLGWIGDIVIGLGLLNFNRRAYSAARWWIPLKLGLYGLGLAWLAIVGFGISQVHSHSTTSILAKFEEASTPAVLLIVGLSALAIWQLWVLRRRYMRSIFGSGVADEIQRQNDMGDYEVRPHE